MKNTLLALALILGAFVVAVRADSAVVLQPVFSGKDVARKQIRVGLVPVLSKLEQPTDIQFIPGSTTQVVVCEKTGKVKFFDLKKRTSTVIGNFKVYRVSELGVLGFTFHPKFPKTPKVYLNYNPEDKGPMRTRISEFEWVPGRGTLAGERVLLEVPQPYSNHNAGQLAFGPEGLLYIGLGDGGAADDPKGNGQNPQVLLGKMLRVNVDRKTAGLQYSIPADNPFADGKNGKAEIFATGIRNPWRYSFDPAGRLIMADVGQNLWEEVSFIPKGGNLGWKTMEAAHCFEPKENCKKTDLVSPFVEYGHDEGVSITGGYSYTGRAIAELKDRYVFGDFATGRIWAVQPPATDKPEALAPMEAMGKWPISISTFGRDAAGELYVADFAEGVIYSITPVK